MRIWLIRHGQTSSNVGGLLDTAAPGAPLTDLGLQQAAALPDALAGEPIGAVYASTLLRAQQTAAPLAAAHGLEVQVRAGLREVQAGDFEMRGDRAAIRAYLTAVFSWPTGDLDAAVPGGENGSAALGRFDAVVAEAAAAGHPAALVSHGAMIRGWIASRVADAPVDFLATHGLSNTGVAIVDGSVDAGWTLQAWQGEPVEPALTATAADGPAADPVPAP